MRDAIIQFFVSHGWYELGVFCCSLLPIIECRGAIPLGCGLGLPWWQTFLLAVAGNLLPVPFILLFIRSFLKEASHSRIKLVNRFARWLERRAEKRRKSVERYSYWAVILFVSIPFPGTGAWTGSLIAAVMQLKFKKSLLAVTVGVLIASTVMTILSYAIGYAVKTAI